MKERPSRQEHIHDTATMISKNDMNKPMAKVLAHLLRDRIRYFYGPAGVKRFDEKMKEINKKRGRN